MKNQHINQILALLLLIFFYSSCCSIKGTTVKNYYFKTSLAEQFITNQPDSVVFKDNKNQLHIYNFVNYDRFIDTKNVECRHCCEDNEIERSFLYYFGNDSLPVFRIKLNADKKVDYLSVSYEVFSIDTIVDTTILNGYYSFNSFQIQADSIYFKIHPEVSFSDSVKVLSNTFYNVYTFEKVMNTSKIYAKKLYYTSQKGIVAIFFNNNDIWELQP